jgi:hypothetical protein
MVGGVGRSFFAGRRSPALTVTPLPEKSSTGAPQRSVLGTRMLSSLIVIPGEASISDGAMLNWRGVSWMPVALILISVGWMLNSLGSANAPVVETWMRRGVMLMRRGVVDAPVNPTLMRHGRMLIRLGEVDAPLSEKSIAWGPLRNHALLEADWAVPPAR